MTEKQRSDVVEQSEQNRRNSSSTSVDRRVAVPGFDRPARERARPARWVVAAGVGVALGVLFAVGGLFTQRWLFVALGAVALYVAALAYYLAPDASVSEAVTERLYWSYIDGRDALDASTAHVYLPSASTAGEAHGVRLTLVDDTTDSSASASGDASPRPQQRPVGVGLLESYLGETNEALSTDLRRLADQLAEAVVDGFRLADAAEIVDRTDERVAFRLSGCALTPLTRLDHPTVSFLGTAMAAGLGRPVRVVAERNRGDGSYRVDCLVETESKPRSQSSDGALD
ncbi:hypothetical protein [Haloprofundus salinisoli]|uniref:hypothetical protein n=1 Tax=Haloprofundus salinisoli TaxID=2876193 RepID=UPI001CCBDC57|nr:hypothetical protein [Haloprofundus salinisoli]